MKIEDGYLLNGQEYGPVYAVAEATGAKGTMGWKKKRKRLSKNHIQ